jgi:hypothetical protein
MTHIDVVISINIHINERIYMETSKKESDFHRDEK